LPGIHALKGDFIYSIGGINPTIANTYLLPNNLWCIYIWGQRFITKELEIEHICMYNSECHDFRVNPNFIALFTEE
jgi:hypothetical protein